jgi:hypothetical protein
LNRVGSLLTIVLLSGTACGSNTGSDAGTSADQTVNVTVNETVNGTVASPDEQPSAPIEGVPEALRFRAPRVGGGEIDMSTLAGKPVVMWFWAPY